MANIEVYLNGKLCDVSADFSIRLNRQLINPAELNTKDAQYSYSIELPATSRNNEILNFANIEEASGKFNRLYRAELIVNSLMIMQGNFILTNITRGRYKGNLYKPALKSISDIFGDLRLNQIAPILLPFDNFAESVSAYNVNAQDEPQLAIFPYVLYGLLPKVPATYAGTYSAKTVWDNTVRMGIQDLPPSMNPIKLIKHIFESRGYSIDGSAFNDKRLTQLYMSYRNDPDFIQPWNYGHLGKMRVKGIWHSWYDMNDNPPTAKKLERGINVGSNAYSVDMLDATNSKITVLEDNGGNAELRRIPDIDGKEWTRGQIYIPVSGFYKVKLNANIYLDGEANFRVTDPATGVQQVSAYTDKYDNTFTKNAYEIHLLRDKKTGDFGLGNPVLAGTFFANNQYQAMPWDIPSYFPPVVNGCYTNFVDAAQQDKFISGMAIGAAGTYVLQTEYGPVRTGPYINPVGNPPLAQVLIAKPAFSWDASVNEDEPTLLATNNPNGYLKYGRLGEFDSEGENPDGPIDYSMGALVEDSKLSMNGEPIADVSATGWVILNRFALAPGYVYEIDGGSSYSGYCYVFANDNTTPAQVIEFIGGVATLDTAQYLALNQIPHITIYLANADYDVQGTLTITRIIEDEASDAIGWEATNKYKIDVANAPLNRTRQGYYNNAPADGGRAADSDSGVIIWLEAGELITVASVTHQGGYRRSGMHSTFGMVGHQIEFDLSVEPFRNDKTWLKVNTAGRGTAVMDWNDPGNFVADSIDLAQFLPNDVKVDDFLDNFCKAFNLKLSQTGPGAFTLDVKQVKRTTSNQFIDLDAVANVTDGVNTPLGLPTYYKIGFTVNTEEEGYVRTGDDGGGEFYTGAVEGNIVEQKSTFSFNWFKRINKMPEALPLDLPIISDVAPWNGPGNYGELMRKRYTDKAFRFWYLSGLFSDAGVNISINGEPIEIALVGYENENNILNYKNQPHTILDNFFTLIVSADSNYTEIEGYLTQTMYAQLDGTRTAKFNGDLYYVAEIVGYDPAAVNKTKIKLIRKL